MILTLNFDNKKEKSQTYTDEKTIAFRKALLKQEKESTKNLPKERSDIDRKWVKMGKMDLLNTLTSFFNPQKENWKACQISFRHNSDIYTVAISYNESSKSYNYHDANEKNGGHLVGWPAAVHLIPSHYTQCGNDRTFNVMLCFHFDDPEKRKFFDKFFLEIRATYAAQKTTVPNPTKTHPVLRSPIDFRQWWLTPQLIFLRECTNTTNEKLSLALKDEEKIKTIQFPSQSQGGFCSGLTRCLMHYGMQGSDYLTQYLDFLSTLITKRDKDSLLKFLKDKKNSTIANKILKFQKNSRQYQQSQNATKKKSKF